MAQGVKNMDSYVPCVIEENYQNEIWLAIYSMVRMVSSLKAG